MLWKLSFSLRLILLALIFINRFHHILSSKTNDKVYYNLDSSLFGMCFRRLNATHQMGCSSNRKGNVGVLYYIDSQSSLQWLLKHESYAPYMTLLSSDMFTKSVIDQLKLSSHVNGVLIINTNITDLKPFSPDSTCPNYNSGLYVNHSEYSDCQKMTWNPLANQMLFDDYPFPIVVLNEGINFTFIIDDCYRKYNEPLNDGELLSEPLCAVEILSEMFAAKDTPTCIRRSQLTTNLNPEQYCAELSNFNVYSILPKANFSQIDNDTAIIVAARLDAFSMFDGYSPGVDSATLGFITVHAVAAALHHVLDELIHSNKQVIFVLFHGEAFDYIGSSRFIYDMEQNEIHNLTLRNIGAFIEIGQVAPHSDYNNLYLHTDPLSSNNSNIHDKLDDLINDLQTFASELQLNLIKVDLPLPPSSVQSFLKKKSIAAAVLSNHHYHFTNRYYNSIFDTYKYSGLSYLDNNDTYNISSAVSQHIHQVATLVARTVYKWMLPNGNRTDDITPDNLTVSNLIYCFIKSSNCDLFNATADGSDGKILAQDRPEFRRRYVSVYQGGLDLLTYTHMRLFSWELGQKFYDVTEDHCKELNQNSKEDVTYLYMLGTMNNGSHEAVCVRSTTFFSRASSPAFLIKDYSWLSGDYSTWTESVWGHFKIRIFLQPTILQQITELVVGLIVFINSLIIAYFLNRRGYLLFNGARTVV